MQIPLQGDATGLFTGRYSYSISVTANYGTPATTTYSGNVDIVNSSGSPFGAGWSLNVLQRIWPVTGGVILELPGGLSLWFASGQNGFTPPAGDTSKLALANNVYTRTLKDGTKINFNSSGLQTSIVDRNNNTLSFGYNGSNLLTTLTDFNSLVTTIAYNGSNKATSITDPANRITTLAYDVGNSKLTALELQGIPASGTGTQTNPATSVLAAQATAAYTDARSQVKFTAADGKEKTATVYFKTESEVWKIDLMETWRNWPRPPLQVKPTPTSHQVLG